MAAASATLAFERAASLRDKWQALRWLQERLQRIRQARMSGQLIYPMAGYRGADHWYLLVDGMITTSLPAPQDLESSHFALDSLEAFVAGQRPRRLAARRRP